MRFFYLVFILFLFSCAYNEHVPSFLKFLNIYYAPWTDPQGAPMEVVENLQELIEDEPGVLWETIEDIWPDYPTKEDFFFNEDEY